MKFTGNSKQPSRRQSTTAHGAGSTPPNSKHTTRTSGEPEGSGGNSSSLFPSAVRATLPFMMARNWREKTDGSSAPDTLTVEEVRELVDWSLERLAASNYS